MSRSFGDASTIQTLRPDRLTWITQSALLESWGYANQGKHRTEVGLQADALYRQRSLYHV